MEAEQYFTTLYKTQVNELTDEVDDSKERDRENQNDKEALVLQIKSLVARADNDARYVKMHFLSKSASLNKGIEREIDQPCPIETNSFISANFLNLLFLLVHVIRILKTLS